MSKDNDFDSVLRVIELLNEFMTVFENVENSIYERITDHIREFGFNIPGKLPLSQSECHILHHIGLVGPCGENKTINGKKLAEAMRITKGSVSKLTAKLREKGLIQAYHAPGNRKEINYSLTDDGREVFRLYVRLHDEIHTNLIDIIHKYDENERLLISDFLEKVTDITQAVPQKNIRHSQED
jgi:DNA-binding MarR family transcriptional regulator